MNGMGYLLALAALDAARGADGRLAQRAVNLDDAGASVAVPAGRWRRWARADDAADETGGKPVRTRLARVSGRRGVLGL